MDAHLNSTAELKAKLAEELQCFSGLNLLHIKREVTLLLQMIGGNGIFDEYTKHDISHIDAMLRLLTELIIPLHSQELMTSADWLMVVLSVYFHDLGMLVTKREYERRVDTEFPRFRQRLLADTRGRDYEQKLLRLPDHDRERFLYQEFVRENHARRIRAWVTNSASSELGVAAEVAEAVDQILSPLDEVFRQDLGLVCESHHRDNLDDFDTYKTSQPYGMSRHETANLHYSALLLRTADLLHISTDRTPSIVFKTISPTDPLSQREWAKQMAVRSVRSQMGKDEEGADRDELPRDTIEVHALFSDENGFFGLTSYLDYAEREIKQSHAWSQLANRRKGVRLEFPWTKIDQSHIESKGFLKDQFEFTIDNFRILELLTGTTLYNDTDVVLRELVQNSIDAVRLAFFDKNRQKSRERGKVAIRWDSNSRTLTVIDNGTGMDHTIITENLLNLH